MEQLVFNTTDLIQKEEASYDRSLENGAIIDTCCNEPQKAFVYSYLGYLLLVILTWNRGIVKPMRLMAVFLHEISHAIACWLTCGTVKGIEVDHHEGGATRFIGGLQCCIIPAGYLGEAFWGMIFVIMSGGRKTATFAAVGFITSLLVALCYSPNRFMVILNVTYAMITLVFTLIEWFVFTPILMYVILMYGVFVGIYSIADIYNDLIYRTIVGSDAYALYEEAPCCLPKCVGVQWLIIAVIFNLVGVWLALVLMSDECADLGWFECAFSDSLISFLPDFVDHIEMNFDHFGN